VAEALDLTRPSLKYLLAHAAPQAPAALAEEGSNASDAIPF
jgi:hypothetical protein